MVLEHPASVLHPQLCAGISAWHPHPMEPAVSLCPSLPPSPRRGLTTFSFCFRSDVLQCLTTFPFPKCSIQTRNSLSLQRILEEEEEEVKEKMAKKRVFWL